MKLNSQTLTKLDTLMKIQALLVTQKRIKINKKALLQYRVSHSKLMITKISLKVSFS